MFVHRCGISWSSPNAAHCATCHRTFRSVSGFDAHRKGGFCLDGVALRERGFRLNSAGMWVKAMDRTRWGG
jgi:hypothetical protein